MIFLSLKECNLKKILLILSLSLLSSCGTKDLSSDQLVVRQTIHYEINSEVPYTGRVTDTHQNGQISSTRSYKDGQEDGPYEDYFENGQLERKGSYKDGKEYGPYEYYHENGQLRFKSSFKDGERQEGTRESYDENGRQTYPW